MRLIARRVPINDRDRAAGKLTAYEQRTGWKYSITATNIQRMRGIGGTGHPQWLDVAHRHHAVAQDRVRCHKTTGAGHLPSKSWRINTAWTFLTVLATTLDAWTRLLGFTDDPHLAKAEPVTMRDLVYNQPARLSSHAGYRWLRFDRDHPTTPAITTAWNHPTTLVT